MKFTQFFLLLALLAIGACKDDDNGTTGPVTLKYDNANASGPLLDAGEHELAVRFPASTMAEHIGKKLTEVEVFVGNLPEACYLRLYGQGSASTPGSKFYDGDVLNSITPGQWNTFKLSPAQTITGEDLWIGVYVEHPARINTIGCDAGPRRTNGDWLFSGADLSWLTYQERTGEGVNWNIRGRVE